jgi:hypothetical protein
LLKRDTIRIGDVEVSSGVLSEAIRMMLYTPQLASQLPSAIDKAASGDLSGFNKLPAEIRETWQKALAIGVFLSVTCSEDIPFLNESAEAPITSQTLGGIQT